MSTRPVVSVITPTIPGREEFLAEARASVEAQTIPVEHLVAVDRDGEGPAVVRNRLAAQATAKFLAFLDDDDVLLAEHCERLYAGMVGPVHMVYSWCRTTGRPGFEVEDWDLWRRLVAEHGEGAIRCVPAITWTYRFNLTDSHTHRTAPL